MNRCPLCAKLVVPDDPNTFKEVKGWVGGPKKDSMRLRQDTGEYAHADCVEKISKGIPPGQPDLFSEEESSPADSQDMAVDLNSFLWGDEGGRE